MRKRVPKDHEHIRSDAMMELERKRKDRVSSKDAAMCRVRAKILQSLPRGSLDRVLEQKPNAKATAASLCKEPGKPIGWKRNRISELD